MEERKFIITESLLSQVINYIHSQPTTQPVGGVINLTNSLANLPQENTDNGTDQSTE